jgi:hypothetical protein
VKVFRLVVKKMLLSRAYLELRKKSYPVMTLFIEKFIEERYPKWYEYLSKSTCPLCERGIYNPVQLFRHLTLYSRCAEALEEIVTEIMNEYDRFYKGVCGLYYRKYKNQLLAWLSSYGVSRTVQLCKESARNKNAEKNIRSGVL